MFELQRIEARAPAHTGNLGKKQAKGEEQGARASTRCSSLAHSALRSPTYGWQKEGRKKGRCLRALAFKNTFETPQGCVCVCARVRVCV